MRIQTACRIAVIFSASLVMTGCGSLVFNKEPQAGALTYFEPAPYLMVSTGPNCVTSAQVVALPGQQRSVTLRPGMGTTELNVSLSNGIITSVGQKTDPKIPETIGAVTGLLSGIKSLDVDGKCPVDTKLYPITNGVIDQKPIKLIN
jgi:uncharacterized protein YceK